MLTRLSGEKIYPETISSESPSDVRVLPEAIFFQRQSESFRTFLPEPLPNKLTLTQVTHLERGASDDDDRLLSHASSHLLTVQKTHSVQMLASAGR